MSTWREDLAWAAGFFDGEGNFHVRPKYHYLAMLQIGQADTRVLERIRDIFGRGRITGPVLIGRKKPCWALRMSTWDAQAVPGPTFADTGVRYPRRTVTPPARSAVKKKAIPTPAQTRSRQIAR